MHRYRVKFVFVLRALGQGPFVLIQKLNQKIHQAIGHIDVLRDEQLHMIIFLKIGDFVRECCLNGFHDTEV